MKFMMSFLVLTLAISAQAKHGIMLTQSKFLPKISAAAPAKLSYYGGPVISAVKLYSVFWGSNIDPVVTKGIGHFYSSYVNSGQIDWLNQYNTKVHSVDGKAGTDQSIGRGTYGGEIVIQPKFIGLTIEDSNIQDELEYQISQGVLPKPDENTLFMVHFPPGAIISMQGMKSCQQFCAYHFAFDSKVSGINVRYGVMPDMAGACSFGCSGDDTLSINTIVSSHEIAEALTDPQQPTGDTPMFPLAWYDAANGEIGDLCAAGPGSTLTANGSVYHIQALWDNSKSACSTEAF